MLLFFGLDKQEFFKCYYFFSETLNVEIMAANFVNIGDVVGGQDVVEIVENINEDEVNFNVIEDDDEERDDAEEIIDDNDRMELEKKKKKLVNDTIKNKNLEIQGILWGNRLAMLTKSEFLWATMMGDQLIYEGLMGKLNVNSHIVNDEIRQLPIRNIDTPVPLKNLKKKTKILLPRSKKEWRHMMYSSILDYVGRQKLKC